MATAVKKKKEVTKEVKPAVVKPVSKDVMASARFVRVSPLKARRILTLIRGRHAAEARVVLQMLPHKAARVAEKVLQSAVANAAANNKLNKDQLIVSQAYADQAFILKRFRAASRGRAMSIHKKLSHITIGVRDMNVKGSK